MIVDLDIKATILDFWAPLILSNLHFAASYAEPIYVSDGVFTGRGGIVRLPSWPHLDEPNKFYVSFSTFTLESEGKE